MSALACPYVFMQMASLGFAVGLEGLDHTEPAILTTRLLDLAVTSWRRNTAAAVLALALSLLEPSFGSHEMLTVFLEGRIYTMAALTHAGSLGLTIANIIGLTMIILHPKHAQKARFLCYIIFIVFILVKFIFIIPNILLEVLLLINVVQGVNVLFLLA